LLGKIYDEGFLPDCASIGAQPLLAEWTAYLSRELSFEIKGYATVNAMIKSLNKRNPVPLVRKARELLFSKFLLSEEAQLVDEECFPAASYLASEGALRHVGGLSFQIASSLHRLALMAKLGVLKDDHFAKPTEPLPFDDHHRLDVAKLVTEAIKYFEKKAIMEAFNASYKKNKANGK